MIINSILSLAFLWSCRRCFIHMKDIGKLRHKITQTSIVPVTEAIRKIGEIPPGRKIFMVIRGLVRIKNKIKGEKTIYSLIQESDIKFTKLSQYLRRGSWNDLPKKSFYRQPYSLKKLVFELQDMSTEEAKVEIRGVRKSAFSGALTQTFKSVNKKQTSSNFIVRFFVHMYNFTASRVPFGLLLSPTTIANETTLYSLQDGQYALAIGQFEKAHDGTIFCSFPNHVTKQVSYSLSKLRKQYNRLCLITFLLIILLGITGIKVTREIIERIKKWRIKKQAQEYDEQEQRSEGQGDNCNCALCYVNIRTIIFKPCRHYAVCKYCYQQLPVNPTCPFCKTPINGIIEVVKLR